MRHQTNSSRWQKHFLKPPASVLAISLLVWVVAIALHDELNLSLNEAIAAATGWMAGGSSVLAFHVHCLSIQQRRRDEQLRLRAKARRRGEAKQLGKQLAVHLRAEVHSELARLQFASINVQLDAKVRTKAKQLVMELDRFIWECESEAVREIVNTSYELTLNIDDSNSTSG